MSELDLKISNEEPNLEAEKWTNMGYPKIGDEVSDGYKIASMPFDNESEARDFMKEHHYDEGYTTYKDKSGYCFIITK